MNQKLCDRCGLKAKSYFMDGYISLPFNLVKRSMFSIEDMDLCTLCRKELKNWMELRK